MEERSPQEIGYHLELLIESGYLKGKAGMEDIPVIASLTWAGHEFLDNIKDKGIWEKTKKRLDGLPAVALKLVASVAESEVKKRLGIS